VTDDPTPLSPQEAIVAVHETLRTGRAGVSAGEGASEELAALLGEFTELCAFARSLADGELDASLQQRGMMAGTLKSLQASLRHVTWQAERVAAGDFSQRVDFMGEFSVAFNSMVEALASAREELSRRNDDLLRLNEHLEKLATTDALTDTFNRRRFYELLEDELQRAARYGKVFSLIMLDIDHFKRVNDTYGHIVGDQVLKRLAGVVRESQRVVDRLTRWGGEEFVVLAPETHDALALAERIRERVREEPFPTVGTVTISLGIAEHQKGESGDDVLIRADQALYRAKENGRDRSEPAT
jgi:diguanylate cyclase (GGDEF)-like protein